MRWESTGAHFTLKWAESGMMSVGRARFKSPLAHQYDPGLTWGYMESAAGSEGPVAPQWHRLSSEALEGMD